MGIFRRQDMEEEDFTAWAVEKRLDMLSEQQGLPEQGETLAELEKILGGGLSGKERTQAGMLLDQARWKEAALYMEGVKDGIRIAKWVCGI